MTAKGNLLPLMNIAEKIRQRTTSIQNTARSVLFRTTRSLLIPGVCGAAVGVSRAEDSLLVDLVDHLLDVAIRGTAGVLQRDATPLCIILLEERRVLGS